jgi:hypothetical protein
VEISTPGLSMTHGTFSTRFGRTAHAGMHPGDDSKNPWLSLMDPGWVKHHWSTADPSRGDTPWWQCSQRNEYYESWRRFLWT